MRGEACSPAWRLIALLLGASWVVTLGVACGGGGDDPVATPVAIRAAGGGNLGDGGDGLAAGAAPTAGAHPCTDMSRQAVQAAALPAQRRVPEVQAHELSDEALGLPAGNPGTGTASAQAADSSEAND